MNEELQEAITSDDLEALATLLHQGRGLNWADDTAHYVTKKLLKTLSNYASDAPRAEKLLGKLIQASQTLRPRTLIKDAATEIANKFNQIVDDVIKSQLQLALQNNYDRAPSVLLNFCDTMDWAYRLEKPLTDILSSWTQPEVGQFLTTQRTVADSIRLARYVDDKGNNGYYTEFNDRSIECRHRPHTIRDKNNSTKLVSHFDITDLSASRQEVILAARQVNLRKLYEAQAPEFQFRDDMLVGTLTQPGSGSITPVSAKKRERRSAC